MNDSVSKSSKHSFRLGTTFWIVVIGLMLLGIALFAELQPQRFDQRALQLLLFRLDFRHWEPEVAVNLWIIAIALLIYRLTQYRPVQWCVGLLIPKSRREFILANRSKIIVAFAVLAILWSSFGFTATMFKRYLYHTIYVPICLQPYSQYAYDGTITWRLFIVPTLGLITLIILISILLKPKGSRRGQRNTES